MMFFSLYLLRTFFFFVVRIDFFEKSPFRSSLINVVSSVAMESIDISLLQVETIILIRVF